MTFIRSALTSSRPTISVNTPTGTMTVSTPEVTVLDMASAPEHSGGLSNVATVIADLKAPSRGESQLSEHRVVVGGARCGEHLTLARGWVHEGQLTRMQHRARRLQYVAAAPTGVDLVADDGVADRLEVHADLMRASRLEPAFEQRHQFGQGEAGLDGVMGARRFTVGRYGVT